MDLDAVRTFAAAADAGQFQEAAAGLSVTQQAVSRRIAALEAELGIRLFTRGPRGVTLTTAGEAFLPHAHAVLQAAERAVESVRPGRRPLRVDVIGDRLAPAALLRDFHRSHPEIALEAATLVTVPTAGAAIAAVQAGSLDAAFRAVQEPAHRLPPGFRSRRVLDEPVQLLTGPRHELAGAPTVTPAQLTGYRIWMPGIVAGTEWAAFYAEFAAAFGLAIDAGFGSGQLLDVLSESPSIVTLVGEGTHIVWTDRHDLRRIPLREPVPVYPHSLLWRADNPHPGLAALRAYLATRPVSPQQHRTWTASWAR